MSHDERRRWEERYAQRTEAIGPPSDFVVRALTSAYPELVEGAVHSELVEGAAHAEPFHFAQDSLSTGLGRRALDVACGDGRHALLLARAGFAVEAIDRAAAGLRRAQSAARRDGLALRLVQADLETFPLPRERYDVAVNVRYLQRTLLRSLQHGMRPGGLLIFETFIADQARCGHPTNPAFLLQRGELRAAFGDFELIEYDEGRFDTESGPAFLARMLARRPAACPDPALRRNGIAAGRGFKNPTGESSGT